MQASKGRRHKGDDYVSTYFLFSITVLTITVLSGYVQSAARKYGWFAATHPWALKTAKRIEDKIGECSRMSESNINTYKHPMPLLCLQYIERDCFFSKSGNPLADAKMRYSSDVGILFLIKGIAKEHVEEESRSCNRSRGYAEIYNYAQNKLCEKGFSKDEEESRI